MEFSKKRADHRKDDQLRSLSVVKNVFPYAAGSVLFKLGNTKVLCAVTVTQGVPPFLRGKKKGWLTAEYSMLPAATHARTQREGVTLKRSGRSVEISRFLGRCLRTIVNLDSLGESTITIDCDVLQADGGTRVASLCGAYLALKNSPGLKHLLKDELAAVSVGIYEGTPLLDLDYKEDSSIDSDFSFVLTRSGSVIEVHGSAEKKGFSWDQYTKIQELACKGAEEIFAFYATLDKDGAIF
jgi:ribonuclease PH